MAAATVVMSRFVRLDPANDGKVLQCSAATDKIYGISQPGTRRTPYSTLDDGNAAIAGENVNVLGMGEKDVLLELGGTVVPGDRLTSDADGKGIATVTDHNEYGAVAQEHGVLGEIIPVEVMMGQVSL